MIPKILREISDYANTQKFKLTVAKTEQKRIGSAKDEEKLRKLLQKEFPNIKGPKKKADWIDFSLDDDDIFYPVNIKSTIVTKDCNLSARLGTYYALTGKVPEFANNCSWDDYFRNLKNDVPANMETAEINEDYYFMVLDKEMVEKSGNATTSMYALKALDKITDNGSNGFQCDFSKNGKEVERSYKEAYDFLFGHLTECARLSIEQYLAFTKHFPGILENIRSQ